MLYGDNGQAYILPDMRKYPVTTLWVAQGGAGVSRDLRDGVHHLPGGGMLRHLQEALPGNRQIISCSKSPKE
jgi:hypothetical protein